MVFNVPDERFPDGYQKICQHYTSDIELVRDNGDLDFDSTELIYSDDVREYINKLDSKADLVNGEIPSYQLPSYVDDIIEFDSFVQGKDYLTEAINQEIGALVFCKASLSLAGNHKNKFIRNTNGKLSGLEFINPEKGKIYVNVNNSNVYRWSGSNLVEISKTMTLGETASTAYAGSKGKANADAIKDLQGTVNNLKVKTYTYSTQLPDVAENGTIAICTYGNLKCLTDCSSSDFIYKYLVTYEDYPSTDFIVIPLTGGDRVNLSSDNVQIFNKNNQQISLYYGGSWHNEGIITGMPMSQGYFSVDANKRFLTWLSAFTQMNCVYIYINGWHLMLNSSDVYTKREIDRMLGL